MGKNLFCDKKDLTNESSVEAFFVSRLLNYLGYSDGDIRTKQSIGELFIGKGAKKEKNKPGYVCSGEEKPCLVVDAKHPGEAITDYLYQISGYALAVNQGFRNEKPIQFVVLKNGLKTDLYKWDDNIPVLELIFEDFDDNAEKLKQ